MKASVNQENREINMLIREGMMDLMVEEVQSWISSNDVIGEPAKKLMAIVDSMHKSFDDLQGELEDAHQSAHTNQLSAERVNSLVGSITEFAEWHRDGYNSLDADARCITGKVLWGNVVDNIEEHNAYELLIPGLFAPEINF
jgi:hypothetical protein